MVNFMLTTATKCFLKNSAFPLYPFEVILNEWILDTVGVFYA